MSLSLPPSATDTLSRGVAVMSTQIRGIVDLLNKPPFSHNYSL